MALEDIVAKNSVTEGLGLAVNKVNDWGKGFYEILPNLILGLITLVIFFLIAKGMRHVVKVYFQRNERVDLGRLVSDFCFWAIIVLSILIVLTITIPSIKPVDIIGGLGFGSLAFGFAFKDILQNWLAGLLILLRLPFRRGDQIVVNDMEGTVQAIEPRATIIRTYDGRDVIIPNTTIYTNVVTVNTSQKLRRVEISITVGYDYNIKNITDIIENALKPLKEVMQDPAPQILCWDLGSTSLGIKIRWWISSERAQAVVSRARVVQAVKEAFEANDIDPTDPQLIFYQAAQQKQAMPFIKGDSKRMKPKAKSKKIASPVAAPPEVKISKNDPEAFKPKFDDKDKTLLPDN